MDNIHKEAEFIIKESRKRHLYPDIPIVSGPSSGPRIIIDRKEYLTFTSNNYLGLALDHRIKETIKEATDRYGMGSAGVRLLSGNLDIQVEFEQKLAQFLSTEDVMTFSSGYLANIGVIRALTNPFSYYPILKSPSAGYIFSDEINHTSIIDACALSKAQKVIYKHSDMDDLEARLKEVPLKAKKLIVTDGVFSMDGNLAKLPELVKLKKKYNAILMVDDSHGAGTIGKKGAGIAEHFGLEKEVDIIMMSFTKAFGALGGLIAGDKILLDYLRVTARPYMFSDPIPPAIVAGLIKALEIIEKSSKEREELEKTAMYLITELRNLGFNVKDSNTPIVPLIIGDEEKTISLSLFLREKGIFTPPIRYPAVRKGEERLRLTLMATHTKDDIDFLIKQLSEAKKNLNL